MDDLLETLGQYLPIYTPSMMSGDSFGGPSEDSQMQVANYKTQLQQYLKDKERWQQEQDANRLGAVSARIFDNQKGLGAAQELDVQTKYSNYMTRELVKAGPVAMSAVLKMMEQQQNAFARGGMPTNNEKDFAAMQANPGMEEYMRDKNQNALPAPVQVARELVPDWQTNPTAYQEAIKQASKIQKDVGNVRDVAQATEQGKGEAEMVGDVFKEAPYTFKQMDDLNMSIDEMSTATQDALNTIKSTDGGVAGWGALLKELPGSQAADFSSKLSQIKANVALETIKALKQTSKTGSTGFGAMSETEIGIVTDLLGKLTQTNSPESLQRTLEQIQTHLGKAKAYSSRDTKNVASYLDAYGSQYPQYYPFIKPHVQRYLGNAPEAPTPTPTPSASELFTRQREAIQGGPSAMQRRIQEELQRRNGGQ